MRFSLYGIALFTLLVICACSTQSPTGQEIDKAFQPLIWPETKVLAVIDVARLKKSSLYEKHADDLTRALEQSGIDRIGVNVRRDVEYLAFSSDGKRSLAFAKGDFHNRNKAEFAKQNTVTFPSDRVALIGDKEATSSALALQEKGKGEVPEELAARIHSLSKDDQIWLVSRGPLPLENFPLRNDTRSNLGNFVGLINGLTIGLHADSGLHLAGRVSSPSPEGATRVHDAFRGLIGIARLSTKDNETDLLKIYDAFQFKKNDSIVEVHADLATTDVDRLLTLTSQRR